ncbi:MAG: hypothetical protein ACI9W6_001057 [Motiliproteus sp.]|jgi:hypothetical protein
MLSGQAMAQTKITRHFENTDHEFRVYHIEGELPGKTMLIIGGMHNEPGGYLTADLFADVRLHKGNLIVVPRANMPAIVNNIRRINGDMNRTFNTPKEGEAEASHRHVYEKDVVEVLKKLIAKSDVLLNLHDGYGFYSAESISDLRNPKRWGQAIIADRAEFTNQQGITLNLEERAKKVVALVNKNIQIKDHKLNFKNTRTKASNSVHKEQKQSATFYALYEHGIESYGIETSKNIRSLDLKVSYQTMMVNAFMDEFDIQQEQNLQSVLKPQLSHMLVSINNSRAVAYHDGETIELHKGDTFKVIQAYTNYQRGVVVDIDKTGSLNDLGKSFHLTDATSIRILKDQYLCGRIFVEVSNHEKGTLTDQGILADQGALVNQVQATAHLKIRLNDKERRLEVGETLSLLSTDRLLLVDYIDPQGGASKVNLVGFVGSKHGNTGEDRGYSVTSQQLLQRFSFKGLGKLYTINAERDDKQIAKFFLSLDG